MKPASLAFEQRQRQHLLRGQFWEQPPRRFFKLQFVMCKYLRLQNIAINQHRAALVTLLKDRRSALVGQVDEPPDQRQREQRSRDQGSYQRVDRLGPGDLHVGQVRDVADRDLPHAVVGQHDVHRLERIELHEAPQRSADAPGAELELVFAHRCGKHDPVDHDKADEPHQERHFRAGEEHEDLMPDQLRAAGEIAVVSGDASA